MAMFAYRYHDIEERSFSIRLATLLPGHPPDTVKVTLAHVTFPQQPDASFPLYECLSYTWGDTNERAEIYVDNKIISVTRNLVQALVALRHYEIPRTMWIDAICINQGNMAERSYQVARMSQIYSRANRVVIWLGPESSDSAQAMSILRNLASRIELRLDETSNEFVAIDKDPETENWVKHDTPLPITDAQIVALRAFYNRPWFERLWVWQEVRLGSKQTMVKAGNDSVLWSDFWAITRFLQWKGEFAVKQAFSAMKSRLEIVNAMMNNVTQSPIQSLTLWTANSKCNEPRDRVYALMGITTDENTIVPDYSLTVADVYKDLVVQNLHQSGNLEYLSICNFAPRTDNMPTWVPDFRVPNSRKRWFDLIAAGEPQASASYTAPNVLEAAGVRIDKITRVYSLPYSGTSGQIIDFLRLLAPPELADRPYVAGGNMLEAYCRAFFANEFLARYHLEGAYLFNFLTIEQAVKFFTVDNPKADPAALTFFTNSFREQSIGRSFFITQNGYVGLAPEQTQQGDEVVHILGSRWPTVLRPAIATDGKVDYSVVGMSYVEGGNDREALLGPLPDTYMHVAAWDAPTMKWWPKYRHHETRELVIQDPRLGALPDAWEVADHEESRLWNWYVRKGETEVISKSELKWRSDPRLTVDALKERGTQIEVFRLV